MQQFRVYLPKLAVAQNSEPVENIRLFPCNLRIFKYGYNATDEWLFFETKVQYIISCNVYMICMFVFRESGSSIHLYPTINIEYCRQH